MFHLGGTVTVPLTEDSRTLPHVPLPAEVSTTTRHIAYPMLPHHLSRKIVFYGGEFDATK